MIMGISGADAGVASGNLALHIGERDRTIEHDSDENPILRIGDL